MGGDDAVYLFWVCFRGGAMRRSGSVAAPVRRWTMLSSRSNHWFGTRARLVPDAPNVTKMLLLSNCSALFLNARQSQVLRLRCIITSPVLRRARAHRRGAACLGLVTGLVCRPSDSNRLRVDSGVLLFRRANGPQAPRRPTYAAQAVVT